MQTDVPLKVLTELCAADLLSLLGEEGTEVLKVETVEMPAAATRLDNVLRLRSPHGTIYLRLIEWQAYRDAKLLWRVLGYLGWLGEHRDERPIVVTIVYLKPGDDTGDLLEQALDGQEVWRFPFHCIRLWQLDADEALRAGRLGLAVLSPLMRGATEETVERAGMAVLHTAPPQHQADLLNILGVFAEPLMAADRFMGMVGRERLMASELLTILLEEKERRLEAAYQAKDADREAELQARKAELLARDQAREAELQARKAELQAREQAREAELQAREAELLAREQAREAQAAEVTRLTLRHTIESVLAARFPHAPLSLLTALQQVRDIEQLQQLPATIVQAADQAAAEQLLAEAAQRN